MHISTQEAECRREPKQTPPPKIHGLRQRRDFNLGNHTGFNIKATRFARPPLWCVIQTRKLCRAMMPVKAIRWALDSGNIRCHCKLLGLLSRRRMAALSSIHFACSLLHTTHTLIDVAQNVSLLCFPTIF